MDDISKKLGELQRAREKMLSELEATSTALEAIEEKIHSLTDTQQARMRADDRIDNKVVDQMTAKSQAAGIQRKLTADERAQAQLENVPLIRQPLTAEQVNVKIEPKDKE